MRSLITIALVLAPLSLCYTPISMSQMQQIFPEAKTSTLDTYLPYMNQAMEQYNINTPQRQAAFLGQIGEETGQLNDLTEIGNADGTTYQGRGAIQLTGEANYAAASKALGVNFVNDPSLVSSPQYAFKTAGWYWDANNLNKYADEGNFNAITKAVNGCVTCAVTHNEVRTGYYDKALGVLGKSDSSSTDSKSSDDSTSKSSDDSTSKSSDDSTSKSSDDSNSKSSSTSDDHNGEEAFYSFPELFKN